MEKFKIGGAMGETFFSLTVVCGSNEEYSKILAFISENNLIFLSEKIKMGGFLQRNGVEITFGVAEPKLFDVSKKLVDLKIN
jgi:hypothetical protein